MNGRWRQETEQKEHTRRERLDRSRTGAGESEQRAEALVWGARRHPHVCRVRGFECRLSARIVSVHVMIRRRGGAAGNITEAFFTFNIRAPGPAVRDAVRLTGDGPDQTPPTREALRTNDRRAARGRTGIGNPNRIGIGNAKL